MKYTQDQAQRFKRERDELVRHLRTMVQETTGKKPQAPQPATLDGARTYLRDIGEA